MNPYYSVTSDEIEHFYQCRTPREDTDAVEFESDSWSDDSGSDKLSRSLSNNSSRAWDAVSEDSSLEQEGSWPTTNKLGNLYFQYFEMSSPYWRVPLSDKVFKLNLASVELNCGKMSCIRHVPFACAVS